MCFFCVIPFNCVFAFTLLILLHNFKTSFEDVVASRPRPSWARAHRDVRGRSTCSRQPLRLQKLSHDGQLSSSSSTALAARRCIYYYQFAFSFLIFIVYILWFWNIGFDLLQLSLFLLFRGCLRPDIWWYLRRLRTWRHPCARPRRPSARALAWSLLGLLAMIVTDLILDELLGLYETRILLSFPVWLNFLNS